MKVFDTDILIEHLRGTEPATTLLLDASSKGQAACSVLTRFELMAGMRPDERSRIRRLLDSIANIDVSPEVAETAAEWAGRYRRSHTGVSSIDYLIAATAEVHGADLVTRNVKHFPMYPELKSAF